MIEELINDINAYQSFMPTSFPHSWKKRVWLLYKRRPLITFLSSFLVLSTISFIILLVLSNQRIEREKATAESMLLELATIFHYQHENPIVVKNFIDVTKKRLLSNPELPDEMRERLLLSDFIKPKEKQISNPFNDFD